MGALRFGAGLLLLALVSAQNPKIIPAPPGENRTDLSNCYIVQLNSNASLSTLTSLFQQLSGTDAMIWPDFLAFYMCNVQLSQLELLVQDPDVDFAEEDTVLTEAAVQDLSVYPPNTYWNLDRIDQEKLPLDNKFHYCFTGKGVTVYIVDTGLRVTHQEFTGRVKPGANFVGVLVPNNNVADCNGHGTHVAGIAVGTISGVAKDAWVVPVRVLDCNGNGLVSTTIAGMNWAVAQKVKPAVINLSLGGPKSLAMNAAVAAAVKAGYPVAVAAGNSGRDACNFSPASAPEAITVGNTDITDTKAASSNFGPCVTLFAPGTNITSASNTSDTAFTVLSGTSMSTPLVTGVVATLLEVQPNLPPAAIKKFIVATGTKNQLKGIGAGSPNVLLRNSGVCCDNPLSKTFASSGSFTLNDICVSLVNGTLCSFPWFINSTLWVQVDLPQTSPSGYWWVGARACSAECSTCPTPPCASTCECEASVSIFEDCSSWHHTRPQCGGIVTANSNMTLGLSVIPTGGASNGTCCFNVTISVAPWTTCSPPHPCCSPPLPSPPV